MKMKTKKEPGGKGQALYDKKGDRKNMRQYLISKKFIFLLANQKKIKIIGTN